MKCLPVIFLTLVSVGLLRAQNPAYKFVKKISLEGDGKWDYLKMDAGRDRVFVSHQDRVHVVDLKTEKETGVITGLNGVHGIALAGDLNKGYISNGTGNTITIFDYHSLKVLKTLSIPGKKADAIMYDSFSKQIFVFNNGSGTAVAVNATTDTVTGEIEVGGAPEFAVSDEKGTIFNNNEDTNEVSVIDAKSLKVKAHFPLTPSEVATGLSLDISTGRLFSGCRKPATLVILDAGSGKVIQSLPIGGGVDAVVFDKELKLVMTSNGAGNVTIVHQDSPDSYKVIQTLTTQPGCKTMAHNAATHKIYLSGADFEADGKTPKPGTFGLFVYSMN